MSQAKTYRVFGLILQSDIEVEYLVAAPADAGPADIVVKRVTGLARDQHSYDPEFDIRPDGQYFHWHAIGAYQIVDPGTVLVAPHDGVSDLLASHALMGLVMSVVLELRGLLSLHASGVSVNGQAAIFLGDKGAGKSTTTGAMLAGGHLPITDDLVAVGFPNAEATDAKPMIFPAFSSTKLYPDSIAALGMAQSETDREIHPTTVKMQKQLGVPVVTEPVPAAALFVLNRSADATHIAATRMSPHLALQSIMRFTFKARYGETKLGRDALVRHMKMCAALVASTPVFSLVIPEDLERLDEIPAAIEQVLAAAAS